MKKYDEIEYFKGGVSLYKTCLQEVSSGELRKSIYRHGVEVSCNKEMFSPDRVVVYSNDKIRMDTNIDGFNILLEEINSIYSNL